MAVAECNFQAVVAGKIGVEGGEWCGGGTRTRGGKHGEGVAGHFIAQGAHICTWGHASEEGDREEGGFAVLPLNREPAGFGKVKREWGKHG